MQRAQGRQVLGVKSTVGQMVNSVPLPRQVTRGLKYKGDIILSMLLKDQARAVSLQLVHHEISGIWLCSGPHWVFQIRRKDVLTSVRPGDSHFFLCV